MINEELRQVLAEIADDVVLFDNPSFDKSIIGRTTDGNIVYDYRLMVKELMEDDEIEEDEAREFIDYNTIRMLPYINEGTRPVIVDDDIISMIARDYS